MICRRFLATQSPRAIVLDLLLIIPRAAYEPLVLRVRASSGWRARGKNSTRLVIGRLLDRRLSTRGFTNLRYFSNNLTTRKTDGIGGVSKESPLISAKTTYSPVGLKILPFPLFSFYSPSRRTRCYLHVNLSTLYVH